MIKIIIFDADGVLLNQERFSDALSRDYGIPLEEILPFFEGPFKDCLVGKQDLRQALTPYLTRWGWTKGVNALLSYWFEREHNLNKELIAYIQELRYQGVQCLLATDNEKHRFGYILDQLGFSKSFDKVYASFSVGHKKSNEFFFLKILNNFKNVKNSDVLFVDDDVENINCAKKIGLHTELFTSLDNLGDKIRFLNNN